MAKSPDKKQTDLISRKEMELIGFALVFPEHLFDVRDVKPSSFVTAKHGQVWQALLDLDEEHGAGWTYAQLEERVVLHGWFDPQEFATFIVNCKDQAPGSPSGGRGVANGLLDSAMRRGLLRSADEIRQIAGEPIGRQEMVDRAQAVLGEATTSESITGIRTLAEILQEDLENLEHGARGEVVGLDTPFMDLDRMTAGFANGNMVVVAARPSMGKSALLGQMAGHWIAPDDMLPTRKPPRAGAIFTMEMGDLNYVQRMCCQLSGVDSQKRRCNMMNETEVRAYLGAHERLARANRYLETIDQPGITIAQVRAHARRLKQERGIEWIGIDYLQLMGSKQVKGQNRQHEVAQISAGCKSIAMELDIPVIVLSQLNRPSKDQRVKRPSMADLRESGAIEQDADVVILIHREDYYHIGDEDWLNDPDNEKDIGVAELIVAKQRNGPTGVCKVKWDAPCLTFRNLAYGVAAGPRPYVQEDSSFPSPSPSGRSVPIYGQPVPAGSAGPGQVRRGF